MKYFNDKVVVITGASSGIGEITAKKFSQLGAKVVLAARSENKLKIIAKDIIESGGKCFVVKTDVSKKQDIENLIDEVIEEYGKIDIFISNAGLYVQGAINDIGVSEFRQSFDVNFYPSLYSVKKLIPIMSNQKSGYIVFVNTLDAKKGLVGDGAYVAAKSALSGFSDVLRQELKGNNINVMSVYPGRIDTPMIEDLKVPLISSKLSPEKVAKGIIRGIKRNKVKIIVPISFSMLGVLNELFPRFMDWMFKVLQLEGEKQY